MATVEKLNFTKNLGGLADKSAIAPIVLPIQLAPSQVRPIAYRILSKKHGLNLKSTALQVLTDYLGYKFGVDWRSAKAEKFMDQVAKLWKEQDRGLFVEGDVLKAVIEDVELLNNQHQQQLAKMNTENVQDHMTAGTEEGETTDTNQPAEPVTLSLSLSKDPTKSTNWKDYIFVVDAQKQPFFRYNSIRKHYEYVAGHKPTAISGAQQLVNMFVTRYSLIHDRIFRNEIFQTPNSGTIDSQYKITMIKNMVGRNHQTFLLFGMLTKGADGRWWLQDTSGKVPLLLDSDELAIANGSYYCAGCHVLIQGFYNRETIRVLSLGPPPTERREITKDVYGNVDFFGIHAKSTSGNLNRLDRIDKDLEAKLQAQERELYNHKILVLGSGIYLDELGVLDALRKLFNRLNNEIDEGEREPPVAIIFLGSFISTPFEATGSSTRYKEGFDLLAQILADYPAIAKSRLVFVPGDNDPFAATFSAGATTTWPLSPVPSVFTNRMRRVAPNAVWTSNPSRFIYLSQEIAIARDDYGARLRRNCLIIPKRAAVDMDFDSDDESNEKDATQVSQESSTNPNDDFDGEDEIASSQRSALNTILEKSRVSLKLRETPYISEDLAEARKVVRTILDQGHLSPFPLSLRPVLWDYDHTLSLTPLPSVLILADETSPRFQVTYEGCHVINPGKFLEGSKLAWCEYSPSSKSSEERYMYV